MSTKSSNPNNNIITNGSNYNNVMGNTKDFVISNGNNNAQKCLSPPKQQNPLNLNSSKLFL